MLRLPLQGIASFRRCRWIVDVYPGETGYRENVLEQELVPLLLRRLLAFPSCPGLFINAELIGSVADGPAASAAEGFETVVSRLHWTPRLVTEETDDCRPEANRRVGTVFLPVKDSFRADAEQLGNVSRPEISGPGKWEPVTSSSCE